MAIINYNSFDLDNIAPMEDPVYGNESYIESEESGFDLAKKRHEESKKKLEAKKEKDEDDVKEENSKEKPSKDLKKKSDIGKKPENKKYIKDKAVEEYNLRHPEDTIHIRSEESALTKAVIGAAAKGVVKNIGMGVAFSVGVALCDMIVKGVTNATARRHLGNVVEPYIEQCVADMISFGEALKMIKDSDIIHELKVIDPEGHYTLNAGLDAGIKKYSEETIKGTDQKKLANHFKNIFVKLYKAYEAGNGFSTEDVALDYSETVINGKASSQQSAQKILTLIDSECKKCGSTFSARSNYFNSDHSFTSSLVMTPTLDVKKMCSEIERHAKKLDTEV